MDKQKEIQDSSELTGAQEGFIEREHVCPLCNSELKIKVKTYLENFTIAEEAYCQGCDVITRTKDHKMH